MNVLAVDTSTEQGSLALAQGGRLLEVVALPAGWRSTTLHAEIAALLARHGLATRDISGYGVTAGPGPFTGVRLGLTAVKGLAEVHEKPVVAISTLEAIAAAAQPQSPPGSPLTLATVLDARRGQVFGALYRAEEDGLRRLLAESVGSLRSFLARVRETVNDEVRFCGPQLERFLPEIEQAGWSKESLLGVFPYLAGVVAEIAAARLQKNQGVPALDVDANYVRPSDAELFWKG